LGFLAGSLGAAVDWLGGMTRIGRPAAVLAGAVLVAAGIRALLLAAGVRLPGGLGGRPLPVLSTVMKRLGRLTPTWRGVSLGLATGLLPCGWLYAFLATAASTGTGPRGAGTMAIFWLGSVPIFAAVGVTAQRALGPLRRHLPLVTGIVLVAVGLLTIRRADHVHPTVAVAPSGAHDHHAP
jgi:sulfite exporter TauE/SafE